MICGVLVIDIRRRWSAVVKLMSMMHWCGIITIRGSISIMLRWALVGLLTWMYWCGITTRGWISIMLRWALDI